MLTAAVTLASVFFCLGAEVHAGVSGNASQHRQGHSAPAPEGRLPEEGTATSANGPAANRRALDVLIERTAETYDVELALVRAVIAAESAYDPSAVSAAGAIGLMQVMPTTAADYGVADARRLFDPAANVKTGVRHLKRLLGKYNNDYGRAIMAYNAGEGVVDRTNSQVTYLETLNYTEAVIRHYRRNGGTEPTESALRKVALLRRMTNTAHAQRLLRQYLDLSLPSVKMPSTLSLRDLDPGLRDPLPQRRPMAVREAAPR